MQDLLNNTPFKTWVIFQTYPPLTRMGRRIEPLAVWMQEYYGGIPAKHPTPKTKAYERTLADLRADRMEQLIPLVDVAWEGFQEWRARLRANIQKEKARAKR